MFDISQVPFSRFGSYSSLSRRSWGTLGDGLYLVVHYGNSPEVFRIDPVREGQVLDYQVDATPSLLTLTTEGDGVIEFVIAGQESIRVRGRGVSLRLEMVKERWTTAYEMPGGVWGINLSRHAVQVALETLAGNLDIDTVWERGKGFCWETSKFIATLSPDDGGKFEAAVDNFLSTWVKPERPTFDALHNEVKQEYDAWTVGLPEVAAEHEATRDLAAYVNWSATVAPAGQLTRDTMLMSKIGMCNVYGWDHAFNAMAHANHQPDLAWDQLMVMADKQDEFGKQPTSMNRETVRTTISNAAIQGWAMRRMWDDNPAMFTEDRLAEAYDYLSRWTDWTCTYRTWPGDELPYYQHGFDGGWDNSTIFDTGVPVIVPDQPAYLVLQMEALADIADALNRQADAEQWRQRAKRMLTALIDQLWQNDRFVGMIRPSGQVVVCESLVTCMPMVLGRRLPDRVIGPLVDRIRDHLTDHGLATEKLDSDRYMEGGYWRGPIWAPSTMLITTGLTDIGETELADTIMQRFCQLCVDTGFYENFSPKTGEGHYDSAYTWTSSVFLIFANQLHRANHA